MKNAAFYVLVLGLLLINYNKSSAQKDKKPFNGIITYSLSYEGDIDPATLAQIPKEMSTMISGNKSKTVNNNSGFNMIIIKDGDKKLIITLMDISMISKKIMVKSTSDDIKKELDKQPVPTIKLIDETKDIAGYKCKKGEMITKDEEGKEITSVFYYTEDLETGDKNFDTPFRDVKGTLMEFEQSAGKYTVKSTVSKVKKQKISDNEFLIPSGYEEMTQEQLQNMFGGGE